MKSTISFRWVGIVVTVIFGLLAQNVRATLLYSEAFNYSTGGLANNVNPSTGNAWTGGNNGLTVTNGDLTYPGLSDQGGNELSISNGAAGTSYDQFANVTSGQLYYSFLLNVSVVDSANNYFTALNPGTSTPNGSSDAIDSYLYSNGKLGLRTAGASTVTTSSALTIGTTYFVVMEYDFSAQTAYLYLNPTPGAAQPAATLSLASVNAVSAIDNVGFKAQSGTGSYLVDNLLVGTTWADVTSVTPVPEPATMGLLSGGLGLLIFARRFRKS